MEENAMCHFKFVRRCLFKYIAEDIVSTSAMSESECATGKCGWDWKQGQYKCTDGIILDIPRTRSGSKEKVKDSAMVMYAQIDDNS